MIKLTRVLRIGTLVKYKFRFFSMLTMEQLVQQSDIWLNRVISTRQSMPRNLPPSDKYVKSKGHTDGIYTLWGWDRQCDLAYANAIWQLGQNQKVDRSIGFTHGRSWESLQKLRNCLMRLSGLARN